MKMTIVLDQNGNPVEAGNVAGELISLRSENAKLKAELEQWQRSVCDQGEVIENLKAELAAETKKFEAAITTNERLLSDVRCANYELAAAQTDAARLAFVESRAYVGINPHSMRCLWVLRGIYELPGQDFRAAIDKEMEAK